MLVKRPEAGISDGAKDNSSMRVNPERPSCVRTSGFQGYAMRSKGSINGRPNRRSRTHEHRCDHIAPGRGTHALAKAVGQ